MTLILSNNDIQTRVGAAAYVQLADDNGLGAGTSDIELLWVVAEAFARTGKAVRLIGIGVRFATVEPKNEQQLRLL